MYFNTVTKWGQEPMRALRYHQLKTEKGIPFSRQWIKELEDRGDFPRHFHLGRRYIAWTEESIDNWLAQRAAESGQG